MVPLFSLLSAACGPDAVTVPLQAYSDGELAFSLSDSADGDSKEVLQFGLSLGAKGCPRLSGEVTAHLNGMLMKMHARGGPQAGPTSACDSAEFTLDISYDAIASQQDARLELSDNTHRIVVVVRHLVAARSLTPRQPLSPLSRGQTLVFDWSPAVDTLENLQIFFNPSVNNSRKLSVKRTGVVVEATVPEDVPAGPTHLQLNVLPDAKVDECSGIGTCTARLTWMRGFATTVQP